MRSSLTWVSAAYPVNATNGTLIQTTITVATKKNDSGSQQPRVALVVGAELGQQSS